MQLPANVVPKKCELHIKYGQTHTLVHTHTRMFETALRFYTCKINVTQHPEQTCKKKLTHIHIHVCACVCIKIYMYVY